MPKLGVSLGHTICAAQLSAKQQLMRIPESVVQDILNRMDILEVVSDYVSLKKKGHYYVGLSPFKPEKTPSFTVTPTKGIFKCFSTGKGGNAIHFLMEIEGYTYPEALRHLAEKYHIDIPEEESDQQRTQHTERESLLVLNKFAVQFFQDQLWQTEHGRTVILPYLYGRGYQPDTIKGFQLGYAPAEWDTFSHAAIRQQFQQEVLVASGLSIFSEKKQGLFDRFRGRIMFPILDGNGRPVGFSGRILKATSDEPKYINSPESALYHKGEVLYGLYQARLALRDRDRCILTEGYADVLALHQANIKHAVAVSGTSLTLEQIKLIKRFAQQVLLLFDGDAAGIKATDRAIELLLPQDFTLRILQLPDNHDPDSYLQQHGKDAFLELIETHALDIVAYSLGNRSMRELAALNTGQKRDLVRHLAQRLALIPDSLTQRLFAQQAAERLQVDEQYILADMQQAARKVDLQSRPAPEPAIIPLHPAGVSHDSISNAIEGHVPAAASHVERELLRLLLNYPDEVVIEGDAEEEPVLLHQFFMDEVGTVAFSHPLYEQTKHIIVEALAAGLPFPNIQLMNESGTEVQQLVSSLMVHPYRLSRKWVETDMPVPEFDEDVASGMRNSLLHFKLRKYDDLLQANARELRQLQAGDWDANWALIEKLLVRKMKLEKFRAEITQQLGIVIVR